MTRKFTPQEIGQISAYLDGQLPVREKNLLELRLRDDPELQSELEGLARTHLVLRSLPRRRAPRSFVLTPAMVAGRQALHLFPAFRLASALAAVLLVVAFASDLLLGTGGFTSALPMAAAPAEKQVLTTQEANLAVPTQAPTEIITLSTPTPEANNGNGGLGMGGGPVESVPAALPTQPAETSSVDQGMATATQPASPTSAATLMGDTSQPRATATPGRNILVGNAQRSPTLTPTVEATLKNTETPTPLPPSPTPTETPTPTYTPTPTVSDTPSTTPTEPQAVSQVQNNPIPVVPPTNNPEGIRVSAAAPVATSQPAPSTEHTILRLSEVLLGATAILTGLLAFLFYRKEKL